MKTITHKHILIVQMDVMQSETNPENLQTQMRVLNEMPYSQYEQMIKDVNLLSEIRNQFRDELVK